MSQGEINFVDSFPVPDDYVETLASAEVTGGNARLTFCTARRKDGGAIDYEISKRLVIPLDSILPALRMILAMLPVRNPEIVELLESLAGQRTDLLQ